MSLALACTIAVSQLAFGIYDPRSPAPHDSSAAVRWECAAPAPPRPARVASLWPLSRPGPRAAVGRRHARHVDDDAARRPLRRDHLRAHPRGAEPTAGDVLRRGAGDRAILAACSRAAAWPPHSRTRRPPGPAFGSTKPSSRAPSPNAPKAMSWRSCGLLISISPPPAPAAMRARTSSSRLTCSPRCRLFSRGCGRRRFSSTKCSSGCASRCSCREVCPVTPGAARSRAGCASSRCERRSACSAICSRRARTRPCPSRPVLPVPSSSTSSRATAANTSALSTKRCSP